MEVKFTAVWNEIEKSSTQPCKAVHRCLLSSNAPNRSKPPHWLAHPARPLRSNRTGYVLREIWTTLLHMNGAGSSRYFKRQDVRGRLERDGPIKQGVGLDCFPRPFLAQLPYNSQLRVLVVPSQSCSLLPSLMYQITTTSLTQAL